MSWPDSSMPPDYEHLMVRRDGPLLLVEFDRPEVRNAFDHRTHRELQSAVASFNSSSARVMVLSGRGPSFCSGSDVRVTSTLRGDALREYIALDFETKNLLAACPKPTVAWIHGYALGGGFELALACDFRAVAGDAVLGFAEPGLGTIPGAGGLQRLAALVGSARAKELTLLGRRLDGRGAQAMGLATWIVDGPVTPGDLASRLEPLLALNDRVIRMAKAAIDPVPVLSALDRTFHELASSYCHDTGSFAATARVRGLVGDELDDEG